VFCFEIQRRFAAQEIRAGRLPLWNPNQYTGAPSAAFPKYSPLSFVYYALPLPFTLAWIHLLKALIAGCGAYWFFRRVLGVIPGAALVGAWCYPLTAYFVLWQGFEATSVLAWFPWLLLATDATVRSPRAWGGPALAGLSALTMLSGQPDVGAQALLGSGLYALWALWRERSAGGRPVAAVLALIAAWGLGIGMAAMYLAPLAEYASTGARMQARASGEEERPPIGPDVLPEVVLPDVYGSLAPGSRRIHYGNQISGAASAYAGLIAALLLAPLAFCSPRHRSANVMWAMVAFFGLSWLLAVPGFTSLLRLPGLNMLSHNRMTFLTAFALLAMAVVGLEALHAGTIRRRAWFALPAGTLAVLLGFCVVRAFQLPEPVASGLGIALRRGARIVDIPNQSALRAVQSGFTQTYVVGAILCGLALVAWWLLWRVAVASPGSHPSPRGYSSSSCCGSVTAGFRSRRRVSTTRRFRFSPRWRSRPPVASSG
jgi:hypothetical protein